MASRNQESPKPEPKLFDLGAEHLEIPWDRASFAWSSIVADDSGFTREGPEQLNPQHRTAPDVVQGGEKPHRRMLANARNLKSSLSCAATKNSGKSAPSVFSITCNNLADKWQSIIS